VVAWVGFANDITALGGEFGNRLSIVLRLAMIDFSSPEYGRLVIDWHIIHDQESASAFAAKVRDTPRSPGRRTSVSSALDLGTLLLEGSEKDIVATRRVIDVSGDGPNNDGRPMTEVHDKTVAQGIIVNGLPVMDDTANGYYPDLDKYYAACVAGGRGAFVVVVRSYKDYGTAMRRKLILEISQDETAIEQAANAAENAPPVLKVAAAPQDSPLAGPQIMRAGPNEFSGRCDIYGGFGRFGGFR
jgi:hypothetical protein